MGERGGGGEGVGVITWLGIIWEGERGMRVCDERGGERTGDEGEGGGGFISSKGCVIGVCVRAWEWWGWGGGGTLLTR